MAIIDRELSGLARWRRTAEDAFAIVRANSKIMTHPDQRFTQSVWAWYAIALAMGLRRLVDSDENTYSLVALLGKIRRNPKAYTCETLQACYPTAPPAALEKWHQESVGNRGGGFDVKEIDRDLADLRRESIVIMNWINDFVAHGSYVRDPAKRRAAKSNTPKYDDLFAAFAPLEAMAERYNYALWRKRGRYEPQDIDGGQWLTIFDFPWRS